MNKILIVGSNNINTSTVFKKFNLPESVLVTSVHQDYKVGHTAPQEFATIELLREVMVCANTIYWAECKKEEFYSDAEYYNFLNWLKDFNLTHGTIQNLDQIYFDVYEWGVPILVEKNQIVFLGCSFTAGSGLSNENTRYSNIVAKHFNKKLLNLAQPGGSNSLIFDKFTRLQLNPNQLVIIQFTGLERLHYCNTDKKLSPLLLSTSPIDKALHCAMLEVYHKDFLFYELLCKIRAIVKIARAQRLKLVFWLADYKNEQIYSKLDQTYFYDMPEFVPASWIGDFIVDSAEDGVHPGIESNKNISNALIKYLEKIYEI